MRHRQRQGGRGGGAKNLSGYQPASGIEPLELPQAYYPLPYPASSPKREERPPTSNVVVSGKKGVSSAANFDRTRAAAIWPMIRLQGDHTARATTVRELFTVAGFEVFGGVEWTRSRGGVVFFAPHGSR